MKTATPKATENPHTVGAGTKRITATAIETATATVAVTARATGAIGAIPRLPVVLGRAVRPTVVLPMVVARTGNGIRRASKVADFRTVESERRVRQSLLRVKI